jgi:hypothetical protein
MKAIHQTTNKLVLEEKAASISGIFAILFFLIIPLWITSSIVYNIGITNLRCDRITPKLVNCQKNQSKLFGLLPASSTSFARITRAEYNSENYTDDDGDDIVYSVVKLVDNDGRQEEVFSKNDFHKDWETMSNTTAEINNFIKSTAPTFFIQQDFRWAKFIGSLPVIAFCSIFFLPGIIVIYAVLQSETLIFNKSNQLFTHEKTTLMGKKNVATESFINFQALQIIEETDSDNDKYYRLKLLSKAGNTYGLFSSSSLPEVEKFARKMGNFLEVPVNKIILN